MILSFLYCVKCKKFGQFIFRKIIKIIDSRCQILCTSAPPDSLAGEEMEGRKGNERGGEEGREEILA